MFGFFAAATLRRVIREAGRNDRVLGFGDDLSCGPIDPATLPVRSAWWARLGTAWAIGQAEADQVLWDRVSAAQDRLVLWFARHCSMEHALFLSWVDRLGDRPFEVVDVTGFRHPFTKRDGSAAVSSPAVAAGAEPPATFELLLGRERPLTDQERAEALARWRRLKDENAPLRVVSEEGLVSAPEDHFDGTILDGVRDGPRTVRRVVGNAMGSFLGSSLIGVGSNVAMRAAAGRVSRRGGRRWP